MSQNERNRRRIAALPPEIQQALRDWPKLQTGRSLTPAVRQALIEQVQRIAAAWGGRCLSPEYLGIQKYLDFTCQHGHRWRRTPATLLLGLFCPECNSRSNKALQCQQDWAARRGWTCLSDHFEHADAPLRWRCDQGHEWESSSKTVRAVKGCAACYRERRYHTLETMQQWARERGGVCVSTHYQNVNKKLIWQCHRGHLWLAQPCKIKLGSWCPQCARMARITKPDSKAWRKYLAVGGAPAGNQG